MDNEEEENDEQVSLQLLTCTEVAGSLNSGLGSTYTCMLFGSCVCVCRVCHEQGCQWITSPIKINFDLWMFIVVQIQVMSFEIKQDMLETLQKK